MIGVFTKEELELLKGLVNLSLKNTEGMIRSLERKKTITDKQKKMLKAFQKSRQFKQNLLKKLEGVAEND